MKSYRLGAIARQLNIGILTIVEYLAKKGYVIEQPDPNSKINEEMYALLLNEYSASKKVHIRND